MPIISVRKREEATGEVAELYQFIEQAIGSVPKMFEVASIRPSVIKGTFQRIAEVDAKGKLSRQLLAVIRLSVAKTEGYAYCREFNTGILKRVFSFTDAMIAAIPNDYTQLPMSDAEKCLLELTMKAVFDAGQFNADDMATLHASGWDDMDIFDAIDHATNILKMGRIYSIFKVEL